MAWHSVAQGVDGILISNTTTEPYGITLNILNEYFVWPGNAYTSNSSPTREFVYYTYGAEGEEVPSAYPARDDNGDKPTLPGQFETNNLSYKEQKYTIQVRDTYHDPGGGQPSYTISNNHITVIISSYYGHTGHVSIPLNINEYGLLVNGSSTL